MKTITAIELGGTLFIPATHKKLGEIVNELKYPELKSLVIDFEDGLDEKFMKEAMSNLKEVLKNINPTTPLVFLRAKDTKHLEELLKLNYIDNITGFVLAKFSLTNADEYFKMIKNTNHLLMPSIEGSELFNHTDLQILKDKILTHKKRVLLVRFGLEDMFRQLGMRRKCDESVFEISACSSVLGNFIAVFKSAGFCISGGVYPCYKDADGFVRDTKRDMKEGLFTKTIIHPSQIKPINELYKVQKTEYEEAVEITNSQKTVFAQNEKMAEVVTMLPHSVNILNRAKVYGIRD